MIARTSFEISRGPVTFEMEVAEPLLKPQTSTLTHARPLTCVIFIFIFCLGIFGLTRKQIEEKLGLEEPGSNLPGCKVVSGNRHDSFVHDTVHFFV